MKGKCNDNTRCEHSEPTAFSGCRMITLETPQSKVIAAVSYFAQDKVLEIQFRSGSVYTYFAVPSDVWDSVCGAPQQSMGAMFHARIKGKYSYAPKAYARVSPHSTTNTSVATARVTPRYVVPVITGQAKTNPSLPDNVIPFPPRGQIRSLGTRDRLADVASWLEHVRTLRTRDKERLENDRRKANRSVLHDYRIKPRRD